MLVADPHLAGFDGIQPGPVLIIIGGVHHYQEFLRAAMINEQIIDNAAIGVQQMRITRFAHCQALDIVAAHTVQEDGRVRAFSLVNAHMGYIEYTGCLAHCQVFFQNGRIPDWHLPPGKWDQFCAQFLMGLKNGCALQPSLWLLPVEDRQRLTVASLEANKVRFRGSAGLFL